MHGGEGLGQLLVGEARPAVVVGRAEDDDRVRAVAVLLAVGRPGRGHGRLHPAGGCGRRRPAVTVVIGVPVPFGPVRCACAARRAAQVATSPNLPGCGQARGLTINIGPPVLVGRLAFRRVGTPVTSLAR